MGRLQVGKWLGVLGIVAGLSSGIGQKDATAQTTNGAPLILPLEPGSARPGREELRLNVNGFGFVDGAVVRWNGEPRKTRFVSSSLVVAHIETADLKQPATVTVTVTNPAPGGGTSNPQLFEIAQPTFGVAFQETAVSSGPLVRRAVVGDFNGDGNPDIVDLSLDANTSLMTIELRAGKGDGTFQNPVSVLALPAGFTVTALAVGDVNGDGKTDLIGSFFSFSNGFGSGTFVLLGNGDGTFQAPITSDPDAIAAATVNEIVIADVNGDGIPDLIRALRQRISVELGNGDGTFRNSFVYAPQIPPSAIVEVKSVVAGDFHKSGKLDIVAGVNLGSSFSFSSFFLVNLPGKGDGTFGPVNILYEGARMVDDLFVRDFDGDGNLDLAAYYFSDQATSIDTAGTLSVFFGNGDGSIQTTTMRTLPGLPEGGGVIDLGMQFGSSKLVAGDFNTDRHMDFAVQNQVVLIGDGIGPFDSVVVPTGASSPTYSTVAAGDFNGDGRLDLIGIDQANTLFSLTQIAPPMDFQGAAFPKSRTVVPGGTAAYRIAIKSIDGFDGQVQLSATGLPAGATATFRPSVVDGSGRARLVVRTADGTATGSYNIVISATSGKLSHSGGVTLNVGPRGTDFGDFTGAVNPAMETISPGQTTAFQIEVIPLNGFSSEVTFSVSGLPTGATAAFAPSVVTNGAGTTTLNIATSSTTPPGNYSLLITASGDGRTHTSGVTLTIGPPVLTE